MTGSEMLGYVDHTLLKPDASWEEIRKLCEEALVYRTASICIPPCYIKRVHDVYGSQINICTVIGFPLGYSSTDAKLAECSCAIADGASELDMVINITDVKNKSYEKVEQEIAEIKKAVGGRILKVIIEACYLNEDEKIAMCHAVTNAGADYIKTSTGFGPDGAVLDDIKLFRKHLGPNVKIKAAGGIRSIEDIEKFINEGCSRIGASSAVSLIKGHTEHHPA